MPGWFFQELPQDLPISEEDWFHVAERKKLRDLHTELRDTVKKLERPAPEGEA